MRSLSVSPHAQSSEGLRLRLQLASCVECQVSALLYTVMALALTPTPTPTRWAYDTARIWSSTACFGDGGLVGRHGFVHRRMLTQQGCIHELHPQHAWPRKAVVETIDLVPIRSHACWYLDVKQSKAQWAKCLPSQGVALFILSPVVCAARIQKRCVGFRC